MPPAKKISPGPSRNFDAEYPVGKGYQAKFDSTSPRFEGRGAAKADALSTRPTGYESKERPMKPMKLGGGGRFEAFVQRVVSEGKNESQAKAIAAAAGRKKYGAARMGAMAAKGRKQA